MRRREFIAGLGSAAAWPVVARAQQPAVPVIGFLSTGSADDDYKNFTVPFLQGLKESGYVEGQNVAIEYRGAENQYDRAIIIASGHEREQWPKSFRPRLSTESCRVLARSGDWPHQGRGSSRPRSPRPWWPRHRFPFRQEWLLSANRLRTRRAPSKNCRRAGTSQLRSFRIRT